MLQFERVDGIMGACTLVETVLLHYLWFQCIRHAEKNDACRALGLVAENHPAHSWTHGRTA